MEGLTDLENFKLTGSIFATVGPLIKFAGQSFAAFDVKGTVIVTKNDLTLQGDVKIIGGLFGSGSFKGVLNWSQGFVTFDTEVKLYPGDVIRGKIHAAVDIKGNLDFNAAIGVYVPNGIPIAGGVSLGHLAMRL